MRYNSDHSHDLRSQRWCRPQQGFLACVSKEMMIFFVCLGSFAAQTNEISSFFRPAGACPERSRRGENDLYCSWPVAARLQQARKIKYGD
jgi:hypothetical protein